MKIYNKKFFTIFLTTLALISTPLFSVISCGSKNIDNAYTNDISSYVDKITNQLSESVKTTNQLKTIDEIILDVGSKTNNFDDVFYNPTNELPNDIKFYYLEIIEKKYNKSQVIIDVYLIKENIVSSKPKRIAITDFAKQKNIDDNYDFLCKELEKISNNIITKKTNITLKMFNFKLGDIIKEENIGIPEFIFINNISKKIIVKKINDNTLEIELILIKNNFEVKKTIVISGFKKEAEQNQEDIENFLALINNQTSCKKEVSLNSLNLTIGQEINEITLGINVIAISESITKKLLVKNIYDDYILITIVIKKGKNTGQKDFKVCGFKTKKAQDYEDVQKNLQKIINQLTIKNQITTKNLNYKIGQAVFEQNLGIKTIDLPLEMQKRITIKQIGDGFVSVAILITKNNVSLEKTIVISGFKKEAEQNQEDVDNATKNLLKEIYVTKYWIKVKDINLEEGDETTDPNKVYYKISPDLQKGIKINKIILKQKNIYAQHIIILVFLQKGNFVSTHPQEVTICNFRSLNHEQEQIDFWTHNLKSEVFVSNKAWKISDIELSINQSTKNCTDLFYVDPSITYNKTFDFDSIELLEKNYDQHFIKIQITLRNGEYKSSKPKIVTINGFREENINYTMYEIEQFIKSNDFPKTIYTNKLNQKFSKFNYKHGEWLSAEQLGIKLKLPRGMIVPNNGFLLTAINTEIINKVKIVVNVAIISPITNSRINPYLTILGFDW